MAHTLLIPKPNRQNKRRCTMKRFSILALGLLLSAVLVTNDLAFAQNNTLDGRRHGKAHKVTTIVKSRSVVRSATVRTVPAVKTRISKMVVVRTTLRPPKPRVEIIPPRPTPLAVWIPGYWYYDPITERFVWISGYWDRHPLGTIWVPGYWTYSDGVYIWISGHWIF